MSFKVGEILIAAILFPLFLAVCGLVPRLSRPVLRIAPWASFPALVVSLLGSMDGSSILFPSLFLGSELGMDSVGRFFLALTALLWLASGASTASDARGSYRLKRYWLFHLGALSGNLGVAVSLDSASFYTFFALMTFSAFGLIVYDAGSQARTAGRVYIALSLLGEVSILSAILLASSQTHGVKLTTMVDELAGSPLRNVVTALFVGGLGVKVGLVPLHLWLAPAYEAAPVPAAAVLSGSMTKAGVLGWIRFLPLGLVFSESWARFLIGAGILMAFYGALVGIAQTRLKVALAYSSLSQMGYLVMAIGAAMEPGTPIAHSMAACLAFAFHHGIAKAALFLGVSVISATGRDSVNRRLALIPTLFLGLSLVGVPFSGGALAKTLLKASGAINGWWNGVSGVVLIAGGAVTAVLIARILVLCVRSRQEPMDVMIDRKRLIFSWGALSALALLAPIFIPKLLSLSGPTVLESAKASIPSTWIAMALVTMSWRIWSRDSTRSAIPPGDLLIPAQRVIALLEVRLVRVLKAAEVFLHSRRDILARQGMRLGITFSAQIEKLQSRGYTGVGMILLVWVVLWALLMGGTA